MQKVILNTVSNFQTQALSLKGFNKANNIINIYFGPIFECLNYTLEGGLKNILLQYTSVLSL